MLRLMRDMLKLIWWVVIGLFRSRVSLEAKILSLRHQLNVLRRKSPKRLAFSNFDRLVFFAGLYQFAPRVVDALAIVEPETVIVSIVRHWLRSRGRLGGLVICCGAMLQRARICQFVCLGRLGSRFAHPLRRPSNMLH